MSEFPGDSLAEWKRHASLLHDEIIAYKEEQEHNDGVLQGLRMKIALKDKRIQEYERREEALRSKHEKQVAKVQKRHDNQLTSISTKLHLAEEEVLLYKAANEAAEGKEAYSEARIATLRGLNVAIMDKLKAITLERDTLRVIIASCTVDDTTAEMCRLKEELKQAKVMLKGANLI